MSNSCLWRPTKGRSTFTKLKPVIGYEKAWKVIGVASNEKFIDKYKETLSFDTEGFPTYQSLIDNDYMQRRVIGLQDSAKLKSNVFPEKEDTLDNYGILLEEALKYNRDNKENNFVAVVEYTEKGIKINIKEKNESNIDAFKRQYAVYLTNKKLGNILSPLGITPAMLKSEEVKAGRAGSTQFVAAIGMANSAATLIKIANNMEGVEALTEEFSHVLVDALRDNPLLKRTLSSISKGNVLYKILGEEFYELMDFYNGDIDKVAEEALGQILKDKLIEGAMLKIGDSYEISPKTNVTPETNSLLNRLKQFILSAFKKIKYQDVADIIREANRVMATLSEDIISEKVKITKTNTLNRNAIFNSLSDRIDRNIKVLKEAVEIETKRSRLLHEKERLGKKRISKIKTYITKRNESALGIMLYAGKSLKMLQNLQDNLNNFDILSFEKQVDVLRTSKTILQSVGSFMDAFTEIVNDEEGREDSLFEGTFKVNIRGKETDIEAGKLLDDLNSLIKRITSQYATIAPPIVSKFLSDTLGKDLVELLLKKNGNAESIEYLLKNGGQDISFSDLWLDSMRDSSNPILQAYDKVVKIANDRARMEALDIFKEIQEFRKEVESEGVTDFEFMFEKDAEGNKSGDYVNPSYNLAEYLRQRKAFEKMLDKKYGENPSITDKKAKDKERREWLEKYTTLTDSMDRIPRSSKFPPAVLTDQQRQILNRYLQFKTRLEKAYPESRIDKYKAIQIRKNGVQRVIDGGFNPVTIYKNWKENIKATYLEESDDDLMFGNSSSGLTNFDGTEYMTLPVLYTNRLKNSNELSTDIFGALFAYAAATTKYKQIEKVVAPLELGIDVMSGSVSEKTKMKVEETRGQKRVIEKINHLGQKISRPAIMASESNIIKKLRIFRETQLYQRYLKDEGTIDVFGNKVKTSKITSRILEMGSVAQLGFNILSGAANVATGIAMHHIEAAAGQYFKGSELFEADKQFSRLVWKYISESNARIKTNKLYLFDELFNIRQDFENMKYHSERGRWLERLFGKNIQFICQTSGDLWLYNRTAIAMCMHIKVTYKGKETTLWDVLDIREHEGTGIKEMYVPEGVVDSLGNTFDKKRIAAIGRKIANVNQELFGIYNEEDMVAANRVSIGRILLQYRKWMKPQYNKRFAAKRTDLDLGEETEGYWRTTYRLIKEVTNELKRGEFQYTLWKDNLNDMEKANIKRSIMELAQFLALGLLVLVLNIGGDDDREKEGKEASEGDDSISAYSKKGIRYVANRLLHETGNLVPSFTMIGELLKTLKNPAAVLGVISDVGSFFKSVINPWEWNDVLQSGDYKGHSRLYKNFFNLPISFLAYRKQFLRLSTGGLEKGINYYINSDI